ncbi:TrmH family RNA methyltransferase [Lachnoclostridium sp. Marseille-P6806]|uniref:TrmH family RNA methyltransferase n=1 Tax=Lachnoclostridium sp. Marseille-P6806 TaxID=2364793 RepID=UPI0010314E63|nr:RNA methyltransferase [Lachnoclostridium sp. Marseille-P6806]
MYYSIQKITDFSAPELDIYARLSENQLSHIYEPGDGLFVAESPRVILRALRAGYRPVSLLCEPADISGQAAELLAVCEELPSKAADDASAGESLTVFTAPLPVLRQLTGFPLTRGVLCAMRRKPLPGIASLCAGARRIAILDNIENPTNVGAVFRSAAALHMDAVLLSPGCADPLYRRAARVSMGTVFQIPWTVLPSGEWPFASLALLRRKGFLTAAMALCDDAVPIDDPVLRQAEKLAVILGNEGDGLPEKTIQAADYKVIIPMAPGIDSLNVAAAGAVVFWQLAGRRSP